MSSTNDQRTAQLNDQFRRGDPNIPGTEVMTAGMARLMWENDVSLPQLSEFVAGYEPTAEESDPNGDNSFGAFEFHGVQCCWTIECLDKNYHGNSDDPADLSKTDRVLTLMLAEER